MRIRGDVGLRAIKGSSRSPSGQTREEMNQALPSIEAYRKQSRDVVESEMFSLANLG